MAGYCTSVQMYAAVAGKTPVHIDSSLVDLMTSFAFVVAAAAAVFVAFALPFSVPSVIWQVLHCQPHCLAVHPCLVLHPCYSQWTSMAVEVALVPDL